jgi:hypothetical protein
LKGDAPRKKEENAADFLAQEKENGGTNKTSTAVKVW